MTPAELIAARKGLGLSQAALARRLGVSLNTTNRWEKGERPIPPYMGLVIYGLRRLAVDLMKGTLLMTTANDLHIWSEDRLIVALCREAGDDVSDVAAVLDGFRANHHADDIAAAARGEADALIRLRTACGLRIVA